MLTKNHNDKQVAGLCLTNIIANFEVLRGLDCVEKTEYQQAIINIMYDAIARLTGAITLTEENGIASQLLQHAKSFINHCSTSTTEEMALQKLAKEAVEKFCYTVYANETKAEQAQENSRGKK